jgi:hypothetical protein
MYTHKPHQHIQIKETIEKITPGASEDNLASFRNGTLGRPRCQHHAVMAFA